jgi:DNA polymerase alpha subunit B
MSKESATFETRVNAGEIVPGTEYNKSLSFRGEFSPSQSENFNSLGLRSKFWVQDDDFENVKQRYRFMYTSLEERARAADKQFLKMKTALCKTSQISIDDVHFVGESSQSMMWVCGRICAESGAQKINPTSLLLEGERESGGRRVILDISELPTYSLFPGQIILVEGINSTGKKIVAKRIIDDAHCPFPTTPIEDIFEYQYSLNYQGGSGLHIVAAAGPFTTSDNLMYQPLQQLLAMCLHQTKPDVLILVGPFVDVNHPQLATGDIKLYDDDGSSHDASYEMVFVERIIRDLLNALENDTDNKLPAHIILIPSLNDAHHEYVFPQPPFGQRDLIPNKFFEEAIGEFKLNDPNKRIHFMPNPCMFR